MMPLSAITVTRDSISVLIPGVDFKFEGRISVIELVDVDTIQRGYLVMWVGGIGLIAK